MRYADAMECRALGLSPKEALTLSAARSDEVFHAMKGNVLLATWGYRMDSVVANSASVWMFSEEAANAHRVHFARESERLMWTLLRRFNTLTCEVHAAHTVACRWLEWLGFREVRTRMYGDEVFYVMQRDRG